MRNRKRFLDNLARFPLCQRDPVRFLLNLSGFQGADMTTEEAIEEIRSKPVVSPWPVVGVVLGLSKGATYDAIRRGEIEVIEVGRLKKVITAPLRRKLGIEA